MLVNRTVRNCSPLLTTGGSPGEAGHVLVNMGPWTCGRCLVPLGQLSGLPGPHRAECVFWPMDQKCLPSVPKAWKGSVAPWEPHAPAAGSRERGHSPGAKNPASSWGLAGDGVLPRPLRLCFLAVPHSSMGPHSTMGPQVCLHTYLPVSNLQLGEDEDSLCGCPICSRTQQILVKGMNE